jgi:hypothetical protein
LANKWAWRKRSDAPEVWRTFVEGMLEPMRPQVLKDGLRALEFGCWKFEKVWQETNGRLVLQKLKSLSDDPQFMRIQVDPQTGAFIGLEQSGPDAVGRWTAGTHSNSPCTHGPCV